MKYFVAVLCLALAVSASKLDDVKANLKHVEITEKPMPTPREPTSFASLKPIPVTEKPAPRPTCETVTCEPGFHCFNGECQGPIRRVTCAKIRCRKGFKCVEGPARCVAEEEE